MNRRRATYWALGLLVLTLSGLGATQLLAGNLAKPEAHAAADTIVVYKGPTCGCCRKWVDHLKAEGFAVEVHDEAQMSAVKARLGIPKRLGSCHTATVGGYLIEGHVPAADIKRLLQERPKSQGLAVPGMPLGSPGMEMGNRRMPYQVLLFNGDETTVFAQHGD